MCATLPTLDGSRAAHAVDWLSAGANQCRAVPIAVAQPDRARPCAMIGERRTSRDRGKANEPLRALHAHAAAIVNG